ncbi:MAG: FHA domain-containing protein [Anaerolineales bacterium]|nr:FHA domain-containing protein [Anaerolineales bacterium]
MTIGRSSECTAVIKDVSISRRHAVIMYKNGHFYPSDSGSRGGTFLIHGEAPPGASPPRLKASEERLLRDGDLIKFYTFAYRYQEGEATQIPDEGDTR